MSGDALVAQFVRVNLGGGYDFGRAIALELVNLATPDDLGDGERAHHTLTASDRFRIGSAELSIALGRALDDRFRLDLYLIAGIQVPVR